MITFHLKPILVACARAKPRTNTTTQHTHAHSDQNMLGIKQKLGETARPRKYTKAHRFDDNYAKNQAEIERIGEAALGRIWAPAQKTANEDK